MQIDTLREYIEFAKYLNFSTAAKKLYISQPALSNHIAGLEKELGVELVRRNQTLELTPEGKVFFEGCCEVVASYDTVLSRMNDIANNEFKGTLKIKIAHDEGGGSIRLPELVSLFKRLHPAVSVKLIRDTKNSIVDDLSNGTIDCAQLFNYSSGFSEEGFPDVEYFVVDRAPITVAANKDHPLMKIENLTFEDILDYPYAMPAGVSFMECYLSVKQLYEERGQELKNIHYKAVDSISDLVFSGITGDEMLILGPAPRLPHHMAYSNFTPEIYQDFCLVYRKENENPALGRFVTFIKEQIGI